jgi:ABC-2 type transport system permease protein
MSSRIFSLARFFSVVWKEFIQMRRDRMTLAMMIVMPIIQLVMFGYAINANPKFLPTAVVDGDKTTYTQAFLTGLKNTNYFKLKYYPRSEEAADRLLQSGQVSFIVNIPPNFTNNLIAGHNPQILITGDATDSMSLANAFPAAKGMLNTVFNPLFNGNLSFLKEKPIGMQLIEHAQYNPEQITRYTIVPGLMGVVLTMTLVMITSLAVTREIERGTMESLLATPVRPLEVMLGKITPYILVGYVQIFIILLFAEYIFGVPMDGSVFAVFLYALPFIAANLAVGLMFSSIARNQLQAVQMAIFFLLPSILLSGFMFPFYGMPKWAQYIGDILPMTHFMRVIRGIMLKGDNIEQAWTHVWPIIVFFVGVILISIKEYRQTLD